MDKERKIRVVVIERGSLEYQEIGSREDTTLKITKSIIAASYKLTPQLTNIAKSFDRHAIRLMSIPENEQCCDYSYLGTIIEHADHPATKEEV